VPSHTKRLTEILEVTETELAIVCAEQLLFITVHKIFHAEEPICRNEQGVACSAKTASAPRKDRIPSAMQPSDQLMLILSVAGVAAIIIVLFVVTKPSADQAQKKSKRRTANAEVVLLPRQVRRALERKRLGKAGGDEAALAESLQLAQEEALEVYNMTLNTQ
jgi:hypothetical protein